MLVVYILCPSCKGTGMELRTHVPNAMSVGRTKCSICENVFHRERRLLPGGWHIPVDLLDDERAAIGRILTKAGYGNEF